MPGGDSREGLTKRTIPIASRSARFLARETRPKTTVRTRRIKEHAKLRRIPVLVFSSSQEDDDIHTAYDYHANGYITKPDSVDVLAAIVDTIERFWVTVAQLPKVMR